MNSELKHSAVVSKLVAKLSVAGLLKDVVSFIEAYKENEDGFRLFLEVANEVIESGLVAQMVTVESDLKGQDHSLKLGVRDRDLIKKHVRAFKEALRVLIKRSGGGKKIAEDLGTSAANLSRMLNQDSVPHEKTLLDLYRVLKVDYVEVKK